MTDIGRGSIFEEIIKINNAMSERMKFKVDMQEALFKDPNNYFNNNPDNKEASKEKRLNKQDIKNIIVKKMLKVKRELDGEVAEIQSSGRVLQEKIDSTSAELKN